VSSVSDPHMNERDDIEEPRTRLEATRGREYWRRLESFSETPEFSEFPFIHLRIIPLGRGAARLTLFPVCGKIAPSFDGIHWP